MDEQTKELTMSVIIQDLMIGEKEPKSADYEIGQQEFTDIVLEMEQKGYLPRLKKAGTQLVWLQGVKPTPSGEAFYERIMRKYNL